MAFASLLFLYFDVLPAKKARLKQRQDDVLSLMIDVAKGVGAGGVPLRPGTARRRHYAAAVQRIKAALQVMLDKAAALKAAKPDLIFSSLLFADLPVFMKQAHAAELTQGTKLVFPAAGWQHTLMKKDFTPEGMIFGHNTLYFDNPNATPMQKEFVAWYEKTHQDYPEWEADRAYFANVLLVCAANNVPGPSYPSLFASVASVSCNLTTDPFRFHHNPEPPTEFLARGIDVEVAWLGGETIRTTGNSFAAPHISGIVALTLSPALAAARKSTSPPTGVFTACGTRPFQVASSTICRKRSPARATPTARAAMLMRPTSSAPRMNPSPWPRPSSPPSTQSAPIRWSS